MSESHQDQRNVELFDISKKVTVAKAPLASIPHLPRTGERIFLPLHQPGDWEAYTVVAVEYFIAGKASASEGSLEGSGTDRMTLYVERSS